MPWARQNVRMDRRHRKSRSRLGRCIRLWPSTESRQRIRRFTCFLQYIALNSFRNVSDVDTVLSNKTPHLAAILSRVATKKRKALFNFTPPSNFSEAEYRPSSTPSFLSRLSTYKLATYANKPTAIDAVAAAKCGWVNDGKDRLVCNICNVSWVVAGREGMTRDAGKSSEGRGMET